MGGILNQDYSNSNEYFYYIKNRTFYYAGAYDPVRESF